MTRVVFLVLAVVASAPSAAHASRPAHPPPKQVPALEVATSEPPRAAPVEVTPPDDHHVLQFGLSPESERFLGLAQLGLTGTTAESFVGGFQLSFFHNRARRFVGLLQPGPLWNDADKFRGVMQVGGYNRAGSFVGVAQAGVVARAHDFGGLLQVGLYVGADRFRGLAQVGLGGVTWTEDFVGLAQVGSSLTYTRRFRGLLMVSWGLNAVEGDFTGLAQVAFGGNASSGHVRGGQVAFVINAANQLSGVQVGLFNAVDSFGLLGSARDRDGTGQVRGAQLGAINLAGRLTGLQVGVVNVTGRLRGVQLGLLNLSSDGGLPVSPVLNVGW